MPVVDVSQNAAAATVLNPESEALEFSNRQQRPLVKETIARAATQARDIARWRCAKRKVLLSKSLRNVIANDIAPS